MYVSRLPQSPRTQNVLHAHLLSVSFIAANAYHHRHIYTHTLGLIFYSRPATHAAGVLPDITNGLLVKPTKLKTKPKQGRKHYQSIAFLLLQLAHNALSAVDPLLVPALPLRLHPTDPLSYTYISSCNFIYILSTSKPTSSSCDSILTLCSLFTTIIKCQLYT